LLTLAFADGLKPLHGDFAAACLTPLETKIWSWLPEPATLPSCSSHATQGTRSAPATAAPPATDGFSASLSVWMLSEGTPDPRSWPSGCQAFEPAMKRLAKICFSPPSAALGSGPPRSSAAAVLSCGLEDEWLAGFLPGASRSPAVRRFTGIRQANGGEP
jgi:hypothetical protein